MRTRTRLALTGSGVVAGALGLVLAVGVLGAPGSTRDGGASAPTGPTGTSREALTGLAAVQAAADSAPLDPARWSALGLAYVQQARLTADPSWFGKAEQALARSLELRPEDNPDALTGQAALAAGRHRFRDALRLADRALALSPLSPTTYGVRVDALTELGRYDEALADARRMLDLQPGVDSYSRVSYAFELRGDLRRARLGLEEAHRDAFTPQDKAFASFYLGELAFNAGDLVTAEGHYETALLEDPTYLAARAGRAKLLAAQGRTEESVAEYRAVVDVLPQPSYLAELGQVLEAAGRTAEAQEQYDVVRALQGAFAAEGSDVDSELALLEADHGDPATALRLAQVAHRDRPDAVVVQDAYAWALHVSGQHAKALPLARQAVRLGGASALTYAHLGLIEAAAGQQADARTHLQRALSTNPHFHPLLAPRARAVLRTLG